MNKNGATSNFARRIGRWTDGRDGTALLVFFKIGKQRYDTNRSQNDGSPQCLMTILQLIEKSNNDYKGWKKVLSSTILSGIYKVLNIIIFLKQTYGTKTNLDRGV